jgi:hypothetical protein
MTPINSTKNPTAGRPNRILIALAAAWIVLSIAIGGAVSADPGASEAPPARVTADQP